MQCRNCDGTINDNARFCKYCGTRTRDIPAGFSLDNESGLYYNVRKETDEHNQNFWRITAYHPMEERLDLLYPLPPDQTEGDIPKEYQYDSEEQTYYHTLRFSDMDLGEGVLVSWWGAKNAGQEFYTLGELETLSLEDNRDDAYATEPQEFTRMPKDVPSSRRVLRPAPPPPPFPPGAVRVDDGRMKNYFHE